MVKYWQTDQQIAHLVNANSLKRNKPLQNICVKVSSLIIAFTLRWIKIANPGTFNILITPDTCISYKRTQCQYFLAENDGKFELLKL